MSAGDAAQGHTVLIVSTDPVLGALLGMLVELEGRNPVYERGQELPQAAVDRHRPDLILVDAEHRDGFSEAFLAYAERQGARVILFGHASRDEELRQRAEMRGLRWLSFPAGRTTSAHTLAQALRGAG